MRGMRVVTMMSLLKKEKKRVWTYKNRNKVYDLAIKNRLLQKEDPHSPKQGRQKGDK